MRLLDRRGVRRVGRPRDLLTRLGRGRGRHSRFSDATAFPGAAPTIWCSLAGLPEEIQRGAGTGKTYLLCVPAVALARLR